MSDEATTTEVETPTRPKFEVYPALTSDNTKQEIGEHLMGVHGITYMDGVYLRPGTNAAKIKVTKERMLELHDWYHRVYEAATTKWTEVYEGRWHLNYERRPGDKRQMDGPVHPHTHAEAEDAATLRSAVLAARAGGQISDKPLPENQIRRLAEMTRQDFKVLEQEMRDFAGEALESKLRELKAEYERRGTEVPGFRQRAEALIATYTEEAQKLRAAAEAAGIILTIPGTTAYNLKTEIKGYQDAVAEARKENERMLSRALNKLEREKAVALRRIQLAGISPEAVKLLDELPDARTMMLEAATATANDKKELS